MARRQGSRAAITGPRVREAALRLFAAHGYAAVSMRRIAAEVGVQAGALYLYQDSKQGLLMELMEGHMRDLLSEIDAQDGIARGPAPERLAAFARFHVTYHLDRPDLVFIAYMELRSLEPDNFAVIEGLRRDYEARLRAILGAGQASGAFRGVDAAIATRAIIAMLTGVSTWFRDGGGLGRDEVAELYARMALSAAGAAGVGTAPQPV